MPCSPALGLSESRRRPNRVRSDLENPDKTRGITVANFITKLYTNLLQLRLLHDIIQHSALSPEQGGFMPTRGCELQVFTLKELVKYRWRKDLDTYAIFIDFKKAYDLVSPSALWKILRHMGTGEATVASLEQCYSMRRTIFMFNGDPNDSWTQASSSATRSSKAASSASSTTSWRSRLYTITA